MYENNIFIPRYKEYEFKAILEVTTLELIRHLN